jgi:AcrR family transcriptional regulator
LKKLHDTRKKRWDLARTRKRLKADDRKKQIVDVTLETIAKHGIQGTTVMRIAQGAGVAHSALYAHFASRREILLAALDAVFDRIYDIHRAARSEDAIEWLRGIMQHHTTSITSVAEPSYALPLFDFIAASWEEGLHDVLEEKEIEAARQLAAIIDQAKRQGTVRQSIDSEETAWMLVGCAWAEETAYLMGIESFHERSLAWRMTGLILDQIVAPDVTELARSQ